MSTGSNLRRWPFSTSLSDSAWNSNKSNGIYKGETAFSVLKVKTISSLNGIQCVNTGKMIRTWLHCIALGRSIGGPGRNMQPLEGYVNETVALLG